MLILSNIVQKSLIKGGFVLIQGKNIPNKRCLGNVLFSGQTRGVGL